MSGLSGEITTAEDPSAMILNIQSYCIHDGPGIRTTVFVKGCPLRCLWCQNPESQCGEPQLMVYESKCTHCGECIRHCPENAIMYGAGSGKVTTDRKKCNTCGKCVPVCRNGAREISGNVMSADEVVSIVMRDKLFLDESGGGMTISGGEALFYPQFSAELLKKAKKRGLHTAVESCCHASPQAVDTVFANTDLAICDIKHMDPHRHKYLTGVTNELILGNIEYIYKVLDIPLIIRIPVIPGCNDTPENIEESCRFIADHLSTDVQLQLLLYNRLGEAKNVNLGVQGAFCAEPLSSVKMRCLADIVASHGLQVQIGGSG